jgi:hypothetical protein
VHGPNPFGTMLDELVQGEAIGGRRLSVRRVDSSGLESCHVLYLSAAAADRAAVLQKVGARPVLTVSDAPHFLDEGGIIQLRVVDRRVRFEIDSAAASRANLRLSSQLLRLALAVRRGPS